jgi:drug/metabolite transporter (DMT)-like permease
LVEAVVICSFANALFAFASVLLMNLAAHGGALGSLTWSTFGAEAATAILFDLPQMILLLWLMRVVAPVRLAARTLVIPLLTVLEGYALLGPPVTARSLCGGALLIAGAWRLMTVSLREEEPTLVLH